jgi:hypothetical protein
MTGYDRDPSHWGEGPRNPTPTWVKVVLVCYFVGMGAFILYQIVRPR